MDSQARAREQKLDMTSSAPAEAPAWRETLDRPAPQPPTETLTENHSSFQIACKRALDVAGSLLILIVLSPFLLLIAALIKIDSPGPVFFRQTRVGRGGELFEMRKFRTMIDGADAHKLSLLHMNEAGDGLFKIPEDPRVTRFGRFLRSTSLDELPQLFQVVTGRMSLVGPRPLVLDEDARIHGRDRCRLEMRPGMTGAWQVAGASQIPIAEMAKLDSDYVADWTLMKDLRLLVGTVPHVLLRRGI
jgi:lipopolysaccharide/colanic/teichoic acid biosynthesis glycosyltransferase